MRQVATVGKRHSEDRIARLHGCKVHSCIGLTAGVRLYVRHVSVEQFFAAFDGKRLGYIDVLAATVVTLAGVAFGVLVGELRALRL